MMLINMVLFVILGMTILVRAGPKASILAYIMGGGFLFLGGYRLYLVSKKKETVLGNRMSLFSKRRRFQR